MIFDRLAIGTANWGKEYNGAKVPEDDQKRILDYCYCSGIDTIHTSKDYGWDWSKVNSFFEIITKEEGCVSLYEPPNKAYIGKILQVPYSIYDRRLEKHFPEWKGDIWECQIHVRSIFLRGKILEAGFTPVQCIAFCLMNPNIDRVILGADSYEQFKNNLKPFHRWNTAEKHDINLLDCRRWETK